MLLLNGVMYRQCCYIRARRHSTRHTSEIVDVYLEDFRFTFNRAECLRKYKNKMSEKKFYVGISLTGIFISGQLYFKRNFLF